jgi:cell division transport system ATP-binding protein
MGTTILFATHDRSLLEARAHRIVVLDEGRAIDVPDGIALSEEEASLEVDIEAPFMRGRAAV